MGSAYPYWESRGPPVVYPPGREQRSRLAGRQGNVIDIIIQDLES